MKRKTFRIREECWVTEENSPLMICLYPLSCIFLDLSDCSHHSNLWSTSILPIGHSHTCSLHLCYCCNASLCKQKFPSRTPTQTHSVACLHTHVWIYWIYQHLIDYWNLPQYWKFPAFIEFLENSGIFPILDIPITFFGISEIYLPFIKLTSPIWIFWIFFRIFLVPPWIF